MGKQYWIDETTGERKLRFLVCDLCDARIEPSADIAESGWVKGGQDTGPGTEKVEWLFCPDCDPGLR